MATSCVVHACLRTCVNACAHACERVSVCACVFVCVRVNECVHGVCAHVPSPSETLDSDIGAKKCRQYCFVNN